MVCRRFGISLAKDSSLGGIKVCTLSARRRVSLKVTEVGWPMALGKLFAFKLHTVTPSSFSITQTVFITRRCSVVIVWLLRGCCCFSLCAGDRRHARGLQVPITSHRRYYGRRRPTTKARAGCRVWEIRIQIPTHKLAVVGW